MRASGVCGALLLVTLFSVACNGTSTGSLEQLATDQVLRFPIHQEPRPGVSSLDPGAVGNSVDGAIAGNVFDGLYGRGEGSQLVPEIASGMPIVSADGLTYTFRLRHDVRFSNRDPVTAADFVYSWNRAVALQGGWAYVFIPVAGFDSVTAAQSFGPDNHLDVTATDPYTLTVRLRTPAGFWLQGLLTPAAWVVDRRVVEQDAAGWWTNPATLVGAGPFRMTEWKTAGELDFAPVSGWWGGGTGTLKRVEVHVADVDGSWAGYASGAYDFLGYADAAFAVSESSKVDAMLADSVHRREVRSWPLGDSSFVAFNLDSGIFSGFGDGLELRRAFSQAVDRTKLADAICGHGTICTAATGGLIAKGLNGYLGDGTDPGAKFDPVGARATVQRLDPTRKLFEGLTFYYPTRAYDPTAALAQNLSDQWLANLGVHVAVKGLDRDTFFANESYGRFSIWRLGWQADYDNPQDWYDNLFLYHPGCSQTLCNQLGMVYERPGFISLMASAEPKPLTEALPEYVEAGRMLTADYAIAASLYLTQSMVVKPYVRGVAESAFQESAWTAIEMLQH